MNKGLEALKDLKECIQLEGVLDCINEERVNVIEKELQALDILKKYLRYYESWYENQAQYDYEHIYLRMENSPFADKEEIEDLLKVKEYLKNEN